MPPGIFVDQMVGHSSCHQYRRIPSEKGPETALGSPMVIRPVFCSCGIVMTEVEVRGTRWHKCRLCGYMQLNKKADPKAGYSIIGDDDTQLSKDSSNSKTTSPG